MALTLEDTDGSLAGYDQVTTEQRVLESPDELADASLLIDGEYAGAPFTAPLFQRVDETTFAAELIYPLREPIAGTHEASVTLFTLGVGGSWGENGYTQYDLPGGDRTLTFSFTADSSANRSWTGPVEQNGYTLEAIVATPGETCVMLRLPEGAEPPSAGSVSPGAHAVKAPAAAIAKIKTRIFFNRTASCLSPASPLKLRENHCRFLFLL